MIKLWFIVVFLFTAGFILKSQEKNVSGRVTSAYGSKPLTGAVVKVKGTDNFVLTDENGRYQIDAKEGDILIFNYSGKRSVELIVGTSGLIDAELCDDYAELENLISNGYQEVMKKRSTGSISKIEFSNLRLVPLSSFELALQGKVPGVFIEAINGKSAADSRIRIRGISTINAGSEPLVIVDGIPLTTETIGFSGAPVNPLASLNLTDIESVTLIRDAASAAIYGVRGASGVLLINTRRGATGNTRFNFTLRTGFSDPSRRREFLNTQQYISFLRESAKNGDLMFDQYYGYPEGTVTYCRDEVEKRLKEFSGWAVDTSTGGNYLGSKVNTDWQNLAFQRSLFHSADLEAQGGSEKLKFFAAGSYSKNDGIVVANGIEKISARLNLDNKINRFADFGLSLSLNRFSVRQVSWDNDFSSPLQLVAMAPVTPPREEDGTLYNVPVTTYYNSLIDVEDATKKVAGYRILAGTFLSLKLFENLEWKNQFGFDFYTMKEDARYGERTMEGYGIFGLGFVTHGQNQNLSGRSYVSYGKTFNSLNLNILSGGEFQYTTVETIYTEGQQYPSDALRTVSGANLISGGSSTLSKYSFVSAFAALNAEYNDRYLLSFSYRADGSSRFGKNNRFGFFPGITLGWIVSEEDFFKEIPYISFMKLRVGYGVTGNSAIGNYWHQGLYGTGTYDNQPGLVSAQVANPSLKWETVKEFNLGLEFGLLKDRISGGIEFYKREASGLLLEVKVPAITGFLSQIQNRGAITNRGVEIELNTVNMAGKLEWRTGFTFSINRNRVTNLGDEEILDYGGTRFMNVAKKGYPLGAFYGAEYAGVDYNNGDALWYVNQHDPSGNIINPERTTNIFEQAEFVILGNPNPDLIGSLTNILRYRGIELTFVFQGVAGNKIHLAGDTYMASNGVWFDNQLKSQLKSWKKPGDVTYVPQARLFWHNGDQSRSSRYLADGSYIKLRDLMLKYSIPSNLLSKLKLGSLQIFLVGRNLLTLTEYEGWDPEVSADFMAGNLYSGIDFYSVPQPRTIIFGLTMEF